MVGADTAPLLMVLRSDNGTAISAVSAFLGGAQ